MEFGAGALKITPGHDPNDFETGARHGLPIVNILNADGSLNANAGPYAGYDRFAARKAIVAQLESEGLIEKVEPYVHSVGHCQRSDDIVEPIVSEQWFVRVAPLAERALAAVREGRTTIVPDRFEGVYANWMENIRDWCISRQLWWGHRIPVWYCGACGRQTVAVDDPSACGACGAGDLTQDEDVLDTWFSSALWPHSTLGWPESTEDLAYFYPGAVLETAHDILFFWVARMMMMGLENMDDVPFSTIYLSGLVRDEHGVKMSKTKGNVIDPLEAISHYGADALPVRCHNRHGPRQRHSSERGSAPGRPQLLQQAVERNPASCSAPSSPPAARGPRRARTRKTVGSSPALNRRRRASTPLWRTGRSARSSTSCTTSSGASSPTGTSSLPRCVSGPATTTRAPCSRTSSTRSSVCSTRSCPSSPRNCGSVSRMPRPPTVSPFPS